MLEIWQDPIEITHKHRHKTISSAPSMYYVYILGITVQYSSEALFISVIPHYVNTCLNVAFLKCSDDFHFVVIVEPEEQGAVCEACTGIESSR